MSFVFTHNYPFFFQTTVTFSVVKKYFYIKSVTKSIILWDREKWKRAIILFSNLMNQSKYIYIYMGKPLMHFYKSRTNLRKSMTRRKKVFLWCVLSFTTSSDQVMPKVRRLHMHTKEMLCILNLNLEKNKFKRNLFKLESLNDPSNTCTCVVVSTKLPL